MQKYNTKIEFPPGSDYINRITDTQFSPSKSSKNPMVTVTCEVVSPSHAEIDGEDVILAGVKTTNYFTTTVFDDKGGIDTEKTERARKRFKEFWSNTGLTDEINWDNVDHGQLKGKLVMTLMASGAVEIRKNPTSQQIADAKRTHKKPEGDIMKHPVTGKPLIQYWPKISEFFGLAPESN